MKKLKFNPLRTVLILTYAMLFVSLMSCNSKAQSEMGGGDIHGAVIAGNMDAVKKYIAAGEDLNVKDPFGGSSPLITASLFGQTQIAEAFIEAGADLNHINNDGSTALHTASFFCRPEIVELLIAKGAKQNIKNNFGSTPLESVSGPYDHVAGVYEFMDKQFGPLGLKLDFDYIEKTRPVVAEMLK